MRSGGEIYCAEIPRHEDFLRVEGGVAYLVILRYEDFREITCI
jgi:hypothetical protein